MTLRDVALVVADGPWLPGPLTGRFRVEWSVTTYASDGLEVDDVSFGDRRAAVDAARLIAVSEAAQFEDDTEAV